MSNIPSGFYIIKRKAEIKGKLLDHYGILDAGNLSNKFSNIGGGLGVIQLTPEKIKTEILDDNDCWSVVGTIVDVEFAKKRLNEVIKILEPYNFFNNNCEHFVSYIAIGKRESPQVEAGVTFFCGVALAGLFASIFGKSK